MFNLTWSKSWLTNSSVLWSPLPILFVFRIVFWAERGNMMNWKSYQLKRGKPCQNCWKLEISFFPVVWQRLNYWFGRHCAAAQKKTPSNFSDTPAPRVWNNVLHKVEIFFTFVIGRFQQLKRKIAFSKCRTNTNKKCPTVHKFTNLIDVKYKGNNSLINIQI